jgi:hypothetical protein
MYGWKPKNLSNNSLIETIVDQGTPNCTSQGCTKDVMTSSNHDNGFSSNNSSRSGSSGSNDDVVNSDDEY